MRIFGIAILSLLLIGPALGGQSAEDIEQGKQIYSYYCYQCHGYNGDARTLASTYLDPRPRDFSRISKGELSRGAMLRAVTHGRSGTAMTAFGSVLAEKEINAVVDYVRHALLGKFKKEADRYHTAENGWPGHDRYAAAFPFANGSLALDTPVAQLNDEQLLGKRIYMRSCISCHDRAYVESEGVPWDIRAISYPPGNYEEHEDTHGGPGGTGSVVFTTPHELHETRPVLKNMTQSERNGERLFQNSCAFCHAEDGSGRNWIGTFLEPHPPDLRSSQLLRKDAAEIKSVVSGGIPGTPMPSWGKVLDEREIDDIVAYIRRAFLMDMVDLDVRTQETPQKRNIVFPSWKRR